MEDKKLDLIEVEKQKIESYKRLLKAEIVICTLGILFMFSLIFIASYIEMDTLLRVLMIVFGFIICFVSLFFALRIEQVAGFYKCTKCNHKYIPTFKQVLWAMHIGRTRYMKCPHCGKKSWNKKVLSDKE